MDAVFLVIHIIVAASLIGLVLLQQGKGADMGAAFGAGASATVFGSRGSGNFLTRTTGILATTFFITSLGLAYFSSRTADVQSVVDKVAAPAVQMEQKGDLPPDAVSDTPMTPKETGVTQDLPPK